MHLLALDVATRTGWASWRSTDGLIQFGSQAFAGDLGQALWEFESWLLDKIRKDKIDSIVVEAPVPVRGTTNLNTTLRLYGGYVVVRKIGASEGIPVKSISVGTWRSFFIGRAQAPREIPKPKRRAWLKHAAMEACHLKGWDVGRDDNAADALGLLSYECALLESLGSEAA